MTNVPAQSALGRRAIRVSEVKRHYGFGKTYLYQLMREGKLRTVKIGGVRLIPIESLEALLAPADSAQSTVAPSAQSSKT